MRGVTEARMSGRLKPGLRAMNWSTDMSVDQFIALNPGFSRPLIRASVTPRIVLPADKIDTFHENLQKLDEKSLVSWKTYAPKKGESLESIAKHHGMTLSHLKEVNGIPPRSRTMPP